MLLYIFGDLLCVTFNGFSPVPISSSPVPISSTSPVPVSSTFPVPVSSSSPVPVSSTSPVPVSSTLLLLVLVSEQTYSHPFFPIVCHFSCRNKILRPAILSLDIVTQHHSLTYTPLYSISSIQP